MSKKTSLVPQLHQWPSTLISVIARSSLPAAQYFEDSWLGVYEKGLGLAFSSTGPFGILAFGSTLFFNLYNQAVHDAVAKNSHE